MFSSSRRSARRLHSIGAAVAIAILAASWNLQAHAGGQVGQEKAEMKNEEDKALTIGVVLYPGFEILDVFGPVEMFMNVGTDRLKIAMIAEDAGPVASGAVGQQAPYSGPKAVADFGFEDAPKLDLILVPGGIGTFAELNNEKLMAWLKDRTPKAQIVTSVCSGSALLAKAGVLDGKGATTNKAYYAILTAPTPNVKWAPKARWVEDGKMMTSSGVSAGMDMALAVIARLWGEEEAVSIAEGTEYEWHRDPDWDPFAKVHNVGGGE